MTDKTRNVFVSHIHEDDAKIGELKDLLSRRNYQIRDYSVTKDNPNNAHNEEYIKREILKPRLDACGILAVIVTPDTKGSKYVDWEIEYAEQHDKRIVCVWPYGHAQCEPPQALEDYADSFVSWDGERIIRALEGENFDDANPGDKNSDGTRRFKRSLTPPRC